jgi:UDP-N-acetylmuramoyl-L-alanyl-D-glutamate--2,6-diaminopimelate ligase
VEPGFLFAAVPGTALDGHGFVADAIARGARAVIVESVARTVVPPGSTALVLEVPSVREALAGIAARFYGHPATWLRLVGFTGTFGKTSTSEVLRTLFEAAGRPTAVIGSLGVRYRGRTHATSGLTTPAPVELHRNLRQLTDAGADTVIMEVTSHALRLGRVHGLRFADGILAAIMPGEHTDFHRTYGDYVATKQRMLDYLDPGAALAYDANNQAARAIAREATVANRAALRVGRARSDAGPHDVVLEDAALDGDGALFTVRGRRLRSALLGRANVRNVGLALTLGLARGVALDTAAEALAALAPLPRRMHRSTLGGRTILDDTAAHPDSFAATFEVADLLPHERLVVAYVVRGSRGADINRRKRAGARGPRRAARRPPSGRERRQRRVARRGSRHPRRGGCHARRVLRARTPLRVARRARSGDAGGRGGDGGG